MVDLSEIVKAYDIRGIVPDQLDESVTRAVGGALVAETGASEVVVGYDMRASSPGLARALAEGIAAAGADVVETGLASTDLLYFAAGSLDIPGAMITASHNPARYNGVKLCRAGAVPIGEQTGLARIRDLAQRTLDSGGPQPAGRPGGIRQRDLLGDYAGYLRSLVDVRGDRRLRVAVDAGNGMAGHVVPAVFADLPVDLVPLYFELDGSFPNHDANPLDTATLRDLQQLVRDERADLGLAFDGDADRCFVVDERGAVVNPSVLTALIAVRELAREPGATVLHNAITSRVVPEVIAEHGGTAERTRVGHSFIKARMAETGAVFAGEHSGHFYFRDFWRADSGMLAALHTLAALSEGDRPLSQLLAPYDRYAASGEINSAVDDVPAAMAAVESAYRGNGDAQIDHLDGLTVAAGPWWFNLRPSNTEPLLRLNVEAEDEDTMARVRDAVLALVRS